MKDVVKAWKNVEKAVLSVRASDIPFPIEEALEDFRNEMILAEILTPDDEED